MPVKEKKWNFISQQEAPAIALQEALKINRTLCTILTQRGILSFEEAKSYFRPSLENMHSPWLMKDMEMAVARILTAIAENEKIIIYD